MTARTMTVAEAAGDDDLWRRVAAGTARVEYHEVHAYTLGSIAPAEDEDTWWLRGRSGEYYLDVSGSETLHLIDFAAPAQPSELDALRTENARWRARADELEADKAQLRALLWEWQAVAGVYDYRDGVYQCSQCYQTGPIASQIQHKPDCLIGRTAQLLRELIWRENGTP